MPRTASKCSFFRRPVMLLLYLGVSVRSICCVHFRFSHTFHFCDSMGRSMDKSDSLMSVRFCFVSIFIKRNIIAAWSIRNSHAKRAFCNMIYCFDKSLYQIHYCSSSIYYTGNMHHAHSIANGEIVVFFCMQSIFIHSCGHAIIVIFIGV